MVGLKGTGSGNGTGQAMAVLGAFLAAWPGVTADPHNYIQLGLGDVAASCVTLMVVHYTFQGEGGVCIASNHIVPDANGEARISISDFSASPTSGFYCQDSNNDGICAGSGEPGEVFCGTIYIDTDANWNAARPIYVRVHGPLFGSPVLSPCGEILWSFGTFGSVSHS